MKQKEYKTPILREALEEAICGYAMAFRKQMGYDVRDCWWVGDDVLDVYCFGDHFVSLSELVYCVDNGVDIDTFLEWEDYTTWAEEYKQTRINLPSWCMGCPRVSKEERERIEKMRRDFEEACEDARGRF